MDTPPLSPSLTRLALRHLECDPRTADLATLDELVDAYARRVPWESATRIAKRAITRETADCPRWPAEFWHDAAERGGGGTCFESNYAFFSLLRALGYEGYLTINDMMETAGCHTAIVVLLDAERWLVDAGWPVYAPVPVRAGERSSRTTPLRTFTIDPEGGHRYRVEQAPHPNPYCFTLIDRPVSDPAYRAATTADYDPGTGIFLDQVIVTKVVAGEAWRFAAGERPFRLASFRDGVRTDHPITGDVAETVGRHFGIDVSVVRAALERTA